MTYLPHFQAQNPAISGYRYGWVSCTAFATAMAIDASTGGAKRPTGGKVRSLTNEPIPDPRSPGLSLAQVDEAANDLGIDIATHYRYSWADFVHIRDLTDRPYIISVSYAPIADSGYDAGNGFRGLHEFAGVGRVILDPLADGRKRGVYKYQGDPYPDNLVRRAAEAVPGGIQVGFLPATGRPAPDWIAGVPPGTTFIRYFVKVNAQGRRQIYGRKKWTTVHGFHLPSSKPYPVLENAPVNPSIKTLVRLSNPGKAYDGWWIDAKYVKEV